MVPVVKAATGRGVTFLEPSSVALMPSRARRFGSPGDQARGWGERRSDVAFLESSSRKAQEPGMALSAKCRTISSAVESAGLFDVSSMMQLARGTGASL
jgi:hypothetical protein